MLYRIFVALVRSQFVFVNSCYAALICLYFGLNYISAFCWLNAIVPGKIRMFALWHLLIPMFSVKVYHMTHIASFLKAKAQNVAAWSTTKKGPTSLTINYHQYPSITVNYIPYYTIDYLYNYTIIPYHYSILYHWLPIDSSMATSILPSLIRQKAARHKGSRQYEGYRPARVCVGGPPFLDGLRDQLGDPREMGGSKRVIDI